jgi:hypothetical protein
MVPSLQLDGYRWRHVEKWLVGLFCAKSRTSRREKGSDNKWTPAESRKKFFPATQNSSSGNGGAKKSGRISPDPETGEAVLLSEFFTLGHGEKSKVRERLTGLF